MGGVGRGQVPDLRTQSETHLGAALSAASPQHHSSGPRVSPDGIRADHKCSVLKEDAPSPLLSPPNTPHLSRHRPVPSSPPIEAPWAKSLPAERGPQGYPPLWCDLALLLGLVRSGGGGRSGRTGLQTQGAPNCRVLESPGASVLSRRLWPQARFHCI